MQTALHPPVPEVQAVIDAVDLLRRATPAGAVLVRGLDVGTPPPTPTTMVPTGGATTSERTLLDAARRFGTPIGYAQEHGGRVVQNIFPLTSSVGQQISTSSDVQLAFHTETAFHPHKSRYLLLLCLRADQSAATTLCGVDTIRDTLDEDVLSVLGAPRFRIGVDLSFGRGDGYVTDPVPVIEIGEHGTPTLTYDGELTVGIDREADAALDALADAIAEHHTSVVLDVGDLLIVDNHRAVHGRSEFRARFDGTDRWLQRTFVVESLAGITDRRGPIITTAFHARNDT